MQRTNKLSKPIHLLLIIAMMSGCGFFQKSKKKNSGQNDATLVNTDELLPPDRRSIGAGSSAAELALSGYNPAMAHACEGQLKNEDYQALIDTLGGIQFGQPLNFFRNENNPYLVIPYPQHDGGLAKSSSGMDDGSADEDMAPESANDSATGAPREVVDIKRADLIGKDGTRVIFLSKTHGLFLVETAGEKPRMTCTTMVPGQPKNFYILNGHLVLINNSGYGKRTSAVVVYSITDAGLTYKTHHVLENQEILDSRLFNDTLVTYANLFKPQPAGSVSGPKHPNGDIDVADSVSSGYYPGGQNTEYIVTSFNQLTEQPKVVFEDILFSQKEESVWSQEFSTADVGRAVSKHTYFKDFISASDRYFVITKEVSETYVERVEQRASTHRICTNYNPRAQEVRHTYCRPNWKQIDNPGFDKDFSCHSSASFAQCVQENENKFVKSYWQYEGSTCSEHSYWLGRCEAYESKTIVTQSPIFNQRVTSHLMIYKYEQGKFIRFDDPTGALPIAVSGSIKEHKSYQFRSGYLMMVTSDRVKGSALISYKLAEKALVFAGAVEKMGPGEDLKAVLFTDLEAFIVTFLQKDPLFRIDLNDPARPKLTGKLDVPGFSSQLIYHAGKLIGIGQTAERWTDHVKVSLFEVGSETVMSELDAVSLGTDMDYSHNNSATDDQLHHFVPAANRLYVPYSGWAQRQASDTFSKVCPVGYSYPKHRLSIFQVGARLEEASVLEFRGSIERVLEHQPGKSLAFSTGSVNTISESNGKYASGTVRELYQTEGIYSDPSLPAGMVVAKQVVRSGGQLYKMRFALGTRDQIIKNEPAHVVEISDDLVTCLGNPQIQFYNNELFIGHNLHHYREGYRNPYDRVEIQISGYLGWKISDAGFQPMADEDLAAYRDRQPTYCWIKGGVPAPAKWEELVDHESRVGELYDCRVGTMEQAGKIIN